MRFLLILALIIVTSCKKEDQTNIYLNQWIGQYEGASYHWTTKPTQVNGQSQVTTSESYKDVSVEVRKAPIDSCLTFIISYNNSSQDTIYNLSFSGAGSHYSSSGSGSSYGSLSINFESDSLFFSKNQKCGMPCSSGVKFDIKKVF